MGVTACNIARQKIATRASRAVGNLQHRIGAARVGRPPHLANRKADPHETTL
ncbi:hypothetical protein [Xanthomonas euvesicatoria]|uniref:hypothetical protein n=1 Tax=Xanthomonas euvesicatoria TaxID=456327 RepID=UPI003A0FE03E